MGKINVTRTIHVQAPSNDTSAQVQAIAYVSNRNNVLLEAVRIGDRDLIRRSQDNGATWQVTEEWPSTQTLDDGLELDRAMTTIFCDPRDGRAFRIFLTCRSDPDIVPWDYARSPVTRTRLVYVQISSDEGRTWSEPEQLILNGCGCDAENWLPGVQYGKNGAAVEGTPLIVGRDGSILVPFWGTRLFDNEDIIDPDADPATANPDGAVRHFAGCLFAQWRPDGSGLVWDCGETVTLPNRYSCDGADEPSVDILPDARLFMVLRARTYPHTGQELPSLHYYCLSSDEGRTWSEPEPLLYDDGAFAYSPACLANVFRSGRNGRFYVITNLADGPCTNCDPRNKLCITEVDTETFRLKKSTETPIEYRKPEPGQTVPMRFSNFRWYVDRETAGITLYMTPGPGDGGYCPMPRHSYRYDIQLPDE